MDNTDPEPPQPLISFFDQGDQDYLDFMQATKPVARKHDQSGCGRRSALAVAGRDERPTEEAEDEREDHDGERE